MNAARRTELAAATRNALNRAQRAVTASWHDLMPSSSAWNGTSLRRARAASRAALEALATVIEQGDLDDEAWEHARFVVHSSGHATDDEAGELLRSVRVVGVSALADILTREAGLSAAERWDLQREASVLFDHFLSEPEQPDARSYRALLATLERSGADVR